MESRVAQQTKVAKIVSPRPEFKNTYFQKNDFSPIFGKKIDLHSLVKIENSLFGPNWRQFCSKIDQNFN